VPTVDNATPVVERHRSQVAVRGSGRIAMWGARDYGVRMTGTATTPEVTIVPANEASWEDLQAVFGTRGDPSRCQCQGYKIRDFEWRSVPVEERADRLRQQTHCGHPDSGTTTGLVAYLGGEPAGWCAVEPRTAYLRLLRTRVPWAGRLEDKTDEGIWAVTCFVTRTGFRRRGVSRGLVGAAVNLARKGGARALEGYPMITQPGQEITWGELHVGSRSIFVAAGFTEVSRPTLRRVVMRIDFNDPAPPSRPSTPVAHSALPPPE
jgi:GNAT superfamily N-acetyltransferase